MNECFEEFLAGGLQKLKTAGLQRKLREIGSAQGIEIVCHGKKVLNFSSNDYLGLASSEKVRRAAESAARNYGAGSGASRLICGSLEIHHQLEQRLAQFKGAEAALTFSSGYAAALGTVVALMSSADTVVLDKKSHASLLDAARLSGASLRFFHHNDPMDLSRILKMTRQKMGRDSEANILVVAESVYSMDGHLAPLPAIVEIKREHNAILLVDEAHALGLFGAQRRGLVEEYGLENEVEIQMGTLGKAIGSAGGFVTGSKNLIQFLLQGARSFMFSTAPVPAAVGAALAGVECIQSAEGETRRQQLWARVDEVKNGLINLGVPLPAIRSAIIPLVIGGEDEAVALSEALLQKGILVPAVRFPAVPRKWARLRITLSADHQPEHVSTFLKALSDLKVSRFFQ